MAKQKRVDKAAKKARKQKIILIVGGVMLLGLAAIQGPKLMSRNSQPAAVPAAKATAVIATGTASDPTAGSDSTAAASYSAVSVAGVALPGATVVRVTTSQLASFTLFETKDPFVQQAGDAAGGGEAGTTAAPTTEAPPPPPATADAAAAGAAGSAAASPAAEPPPVIYATIDLDGKPQQLQVTKVKQEFPQGDPMFVLVSVKKKQAKIGVAGGSFDDGQTVTLTLGKKVTLVNTATGVRYELKLVYTGTAPEVIEGFSAGQKQAATVDASAAASTANAAAAATP
jgi:hypothetical protein